MGQSIIELFNEHGALTMPAPIARIYRRALYQGAQDELT